MDELEALDKKALEQQMIIEYQSGGRILMAGCVVVFFICGLVAGGVFIFVSLINLIIK